jgi:DUF1009 family protein
MRIGLIAGNGQFPIIFCKKAREAGFEIYAAAYKQEANPEIAAYVDEIEWLHLGQVNRLIKYFKKHQVDQAVLVGGVKKTKIFKDLKPDIKAISLIAGLRHTHDDGILRAFAGLLEKNGIVVRPSTFLLPDLLAPEGCWTRRKPSRGEKSEIELGWTVAKEIGRLDIGQCVVVGGGSILAVEAVDGTDATIKRGGGLGNGNAVVVKVCKPTQDERFDVPAIGVDTIQTMSEAGARVLAIEAGKAIVFDRGEMIRLADRHGIAIIALDKP